MGSVWGEGRSLCALILLLKKKDTTKIWCGLFFFYQPAFYSLWEREILPSCGKQVMPLFPSNPESRPSKADVGPLVFHGRP